MKKIITAIIILGITIALYILIIPNEIKSDETIIKESLSVLYNVADANELDKFSDPTELILAHNQYKFLFSDSAFDKLKKDRLHLLYREVAKKDQFTIELINAEIEQLWVSEKDGTILNKYKKIAYEYKVELELTYIENGKKETIYEEGYINLVEIKEERKVDLMMYKVLNDQFKKSLYSK